VAAKNNLGELNAPRFYSRKSFVVSFFILRAGKYLLEGFVLAGVLRKVQIQLNPRALQSFLAKVQGCFDQLANIKFLRIIATGVLQIVNWILRQLEHDLFLC
jgi:hypothetical protein